MVLDKKNPLQVKISGVPYKITHVLTWKDVPHNEGTLSNLLGEISYTKNSIRIDGSAHPKIQQQTLLHEILHGIIETIQIRELIDNKGHHLEIPISQLAFGLCEALESLGLELPICEENNG